MTDTKQAVRELREALAARAKDAKDFLGTCGMGEPPDDEPLLTASIRHLPAVLDRLAELEAIVSRPSSRYCNMAECAKERATLTAERDEAVALLGTIVTHEEGSAGE